MQSFLEIAYILKLMIHIWQEKREVSEEQLLSEKKLLQPNVSSFYQTPISEPDCLFYSHEIDLFAYVDLQPFI